MNGTDIITNSRLRSLKTCPRQHYYRYEKGLRSEREAPALRFGSAFHLGLELIGNGMHIDDAAEHIRDRYAVVPSYIDPADHAIECETVIRLLYAHQWRWQADGIEVIEAESVFVLPILNPETGAATPLFKRSGKIDRKVRLPDGRVALQEYKTTSDDIAPDSDYWGILRLDPQVSGYFAADDSIQAIIYDVTRKPTIRPSQIPLTDEDGIKIVVDADGNRVRNKTGGWRQTGDAAQGFKLQTRTETAHEFGERLTADIGERPDFYFARMEVARLSSDIDEYHAELWQDQQLLRHRQKLGLWTKNPGRSTCDWCEYKALCFNGTYPLNGEVPAGFMRASDIHPELNTEQTNGIGTEVAAEDAANVPAGTN